MKKAKDLQAPGFNYREISVDDEGWLRVNYKKGTRPAVLLTRPPKTRTSPPGPSSGGEK